MIKTKEEIIELIENLQKTKRILHKIPVWERQEDYTEKDENGNEYTVFTQKYNTAKKAFDTARNAVIEALQIKDTKYNKMSAVKFLDKQQIAERMSIEDALAIHRRLLK